MAKNGVWLRATPWPFKYSVVPGKGLAVNTPSQSGVELLVFGDAQTRPRHQLRSTPRHVLKTPRKVLADQ